MIKKFDMPNNLRVKMSKRMTCFMEYVSKKKLKSRVDVCMDQLKQISNNEIYEIDDKDVLNFLIFKDEQLYVYSSISQERCLKIPIWVSKNIKTFLDFLNIHMHFMYKFVRFVLAKIVKRPTIHIDICTVASTPSMTNSVFLFAENQIIFGTVCLICHYLGANTYLCEMCYGDAVWLKGMRCQAAVQQFWVLFPLSPKLEDLSHNGRCRGANDQAL